MFGVAICAVGGLLVAWHLRARRMLEKHEVRPAELDFALRQYRRRMQASAMMLLIGAAILVSPWIVHDGLASVLYWLAVLLVLLWMAALALADMLATQFHFARQRDRIHLERAQLEMQVAKSAKPRHSTDGAMSQVRPDRPGGAPS